ncbi:MAG TPA: hypothetical protein PLM20_05780 [Syntrophomonadaceae bacterium]|nr:hypothetical protein [Syntrophomonadaceae bacterium]HQE23393.1 hypothetical protein [Syntrophomonadaceae bacterium]
MITLIASATSQTQAASALTDLRNRGYEVEAALVKSSEAHADAYAGQVSHFFDQDNYIVTIRCEPDEAKHIKEHLGELHGLDHIKIISEND